MISFEYPIIRRFVLAVACLSFFAVSDIWAQADQESVEVENTSANVGENDGADKSGTDATTMEGAEPVDPSTSAVKQEKPKTGKSEVEYNEDNYRRFMELKNQDRRSSTLPTNAFQPGTQKLDELPEESQKHLRNELRGVIVKEGEWQEGDENNQYAYVPSEAAKGNSELQQLEAEAWVELVDKYQEREAQIHANSARSEAARQAGASSSAAPSGESGQQGQNGQGQKGQAGQQGQSGQNGGSQGQQSGQASQSGQSGAQNQQQSQSEDSSAASENSYSPADAAKQQESTRNQGVSENALQFLTNGQQQGPQQGQQQGQAGNQSGNQADAGQSEAEEADSEQASEAEAEKANSAASQESQNTPVATPGLKPDESGTTQNAFEQLRGEAQQQNTPPDTLLIQDLINAQGVVGEVPEQQPDNNQASPESQKDNDSPDGR